MRIHTVYADGTDYSSLFVDVVPDQYNAGAAITVDGKTLYAGGNIIANGDFAMGTYGWTNGAGAELSQPHFQVVSRGGYDDTPFLQAYSNTGQTGAGSIYTTFDVQPNTNYYVSGAVRFPSGSQYSTVILKGDGLADSTVYTVPSNSDTWKKFGATFNTGNHSKATLSFRWLAAQAEYGQLSLQRLFDTQAEAIADGEAQAARRAELEKAHPTFAAKEAQAQADSLAAASKALQDAGLDVAAFYTYNATTGYIDEPQFTTTVPSWVVASTYTGGTQARSSLDGTTCWTALWTGVAASEGTKQSLEVRQQLQSNLSHGVYMLSVDAAADHLCLTDQHGYFSVNGDSLVTPTLTWDVADLPTIDAAKKWQTLSTVPVYVDNKTAAAIGFTSTKAGATDNAWKPYGDQNGKGDQREGSWYATNFSLLHLPVYRLHTDAGLWRGICLPYAVKAADNLKLYTIAGKSADGKNIYLQAVDSVEAGQPCVANVADTVQMVLEEGTPVTRAKSIQNGLRGYLETSSRAAQNTLVLKDGYWQTQTSSVRNERAALTDYMAIIRKIDDVPVLDSWSGVSLPVDSSTPTAISNVSKDKASAPVYYFDLSGRRVSAPVPGNVYIRVQGDKVEKVAK